MSISIIIMVYHNYSKKMHGRHPRPKHAKTQRGGMKPVSIMNLHTIYDDKAIRHLFLTDSEGREVSIFFNNTIKIIQMPNGLDAKLYRTGELCFNSKNVTEYPVWMTKTFQLNEIDPSPPPSDCMKTILSMIQTSNNDYEMVEGRDDLLCLRKKFATNSKWESLKPDIDQFVVAFIKIYKQFIEMTAPVVHAAKIEQMKLAEESSLSFLDDFDDMIRAFQSQFISKRRKDELIQLKAGALSAYNSENMPEFKRLMSEFIRKLIEMDYIMKHCRVNDQAVFDACKMVAEDKGIVNMTHGGPSILINSAKLLIEELKKQLKKQRIQQSEPLPPTPEPLPPTSIDWSNVHSVSTLGWGGRRIMQKYKKSFRRCKGRNSHKLTKSK